MNGLVERGQLAVTWLATQPGDYDPSTGKGPDWGKAAPIGLLIILLMGLALFFLIRSMNKNLRRVPASFDPSSGAGGQASAVDDGSVAVTPPGTAAAAPSPSGPAPGEEPPPAR